MSGIINKVKEAVSGDHHSSSTTTHTTHTSSHGAPEGTHGPHSSRVGNAADPRVDSDRDNRANPHSTVGGTGYAAGDNYTTGTTGHTAGYGTTGHNTTSGPHSSNLANKADPRIDSDRDGRFAGNQAGDRYGSGPEGVAGPHNSRLGNAVDPRVDSDRDGSRTAGNTYGSSGTAGTYGHTGTTGHAGTTGHGYAGEPGYGATGTHGTGPHGVPGSHGYAAGGPTGTTGTHGGVGHSGPGPAPNTAGPHKSDMANKIDPRVDSDLDNSRTIGGNKTYQQGGAHVRKDPTDAAQVPPSTLRQHVGEPLVEHGDHGHGHGERHGVSSQQEKHRGI